jgi:uncharacterized protein DUF955
MPKLNIPFLTESSIEAKAEQLLHAYQRSFPCIMPPVPVDEIADCHLGLSVRCEDLSWLHADRNVLGATWIDSNEVAIDTTLDPHNFPRMVGRYRFTLGHEVGHWILHASLYSAAAAQKDLFSQERIPPIICRAPGSTKPREEWQADLFSGYLLMPKRLVVAAWRNLYGDTPYRVVADGVTLAGAWSLANPDTSTGTEAKEMAALFDVSVQAMQIRLAGLALLREATGQVGMY